MPSPRTPESNGGSPAVSLLVETSVWSLALLDRRTGPSRSNASQRWPSSSLIRTITLERRKSETPADVAACQWERWMPSSPAVSQQRAEPVDEGPRRSSSCQARCVQLALTRVSPWRWATARGRASAARRPELAQGRGRDELQQHPVTDPELSAFDLREPSLRRRVAPVAVKQRHQPTGIQVATRAGLAHGI